MNDIILRAGLAPVFPQAERITIGDRERVTVLASGLKLRDLMAIEAMKVALAESKNSVFADPEVERLAAVADEAYSMADAMLQRREEAA